MEVPVERAFSRVAAIVVSASQLAGCTREAAHTAFTALAQAEQIDFYSVVVQPDALGRYSLRMDPGTGCADFAVTESELSGMLASRQWTATRTVGGGPVTTTVDFSFDRIERCVTPVEVKLTNNDLSVPVFDGNGVETGRARPGNLGVADVTAKLSGRGELEVRLVSREINLIGVTDSRTRAPGPVGLSTIEIGARLVGATGGPFTMANMIAPFSAAAISDVLEDPRRFTGTLSFLARQAPAAGVAVGSPTALLLVWDGDLVLRTDL